MGYVNTIIYETLLALDKTVSSIKDVVKPEKLQQLVSSARGDAHVTFRSLQVYPCGKYPHPAQVQFEGRSAA